MSNREDHRLVEHLYDELSPSEEQAFRRLLADDDAMAADAAALEATLSNLREALPAEEPAPHLDAKIMAYAREAAARSEEQSWVGRFRRFLRGPALGLVAAGTAAVIGAFVILPQMRERPNDAASVAMESAGAQSKGAAPPTSAVLDGLATHPAAPPAPIVADPPAQPDPQDLGGARLAAKAEELRAEPEGAPANVRLDEAQAKKRELAQKVGQDMDRWERQANDGLAPAGGVPGAPSARGGGGAMGEGTVIREKVVAQFEAPSDDRAEPVEAEAAAEAKEDAPVARRVRAAPAKPAPKASESDEAYGDAVAALPAEPSPSPATAAPPAQGRVAGPEVAKTADSSGVGASAVAPAKKAKVESSAVGGKAAPTSPARITMAQARERLGANDLARAATLARLGANQAAATPDRDWANLEAADILYRAGYFEESAQYAARVGTTDLAARSRAQTLARMAKAKAVERKAAASENAAPPVESDSAPAATTR